MHRFFANWYSLARPEPTSDTLDKRWAGLESYCKGIETKNVFELARLFFGRPVRDESSEEKFRQSFKDADSAFLMKDNSLEVQVLAGAAIVNILDQTPSHVTDATALAVLSANCRGLQSKVVVTDVINYAKDYIDKESTRVRESNNVRSVKGSPPIPPEELTTLRSSLKDGSVANNPDVLVKLIERTATATSDLSRLAADSIAKLSTNLTIQQEETNILWWLFGEHSRDRQIYVGRIDLPGLCLLVGKELADLTILQPGARPAPAFIDRMLRTGRRELPATVTLSEAVESSAREWRRAWMNSSDPTTVGDICPAHFATSKSLETEDARGWVSVFESRTGLDASRPIAPLELAMQTYQEALLIRLSTNE